MSATTTFREWSRECVSTEWNGDKTIRVWEAADGSIVYDYFSESGKLMSQVVIMEENLTTWINQE